ncbi:MAG: Eco57I restriction-modification methylase domain-containing protein [Candidatus Avelusimicrobium sp.]|uniref:Eco57I restriction-modification methylase domain-containing protein n=1 Tax=Candidatus Avelusimicrobium sp. TaxID=3048833 RepID=UPI003F039F51
MTNNTLLRQSRLMLAAERLTPQQEHLFLTHFFARVWAHKATGKSYEAADQALKPFLPATPPDISGDTTQRLYALFEPVKTGQEGEENAFTPEILSLLHETSVKKQGVFYTPWPLAAQLVRETLNAWKRIHEFENAQNHAFSYALSRFTVCDPAAGAGGLLLPFWLEMEKLIPENGANKADRLTEISRRLYAADTDASALQTLRLRAALTIYSLGKTPLADLFAHLLAGDALAGGKNSVWQDKFPSVFSGGGFDAIICNPPYIGQKGHKELFEPLRQNPRWQPYLTPKSDLLYLFFHLALEILKPQGIGGFLTTAYFAQASSAAKLRKRLKQETALLRLIDFNNKQLFSRAIGQHNLITIFQKTDRKTAICLRGRTQQTVFQHELYSSSSDFLNTREQDGEISAVLQKMAAAPFRLKDVARVSNGLMTGCDKISAAHLSNHPLSGIQKGEGVFILSQAQKDALGLSRAEEAKLKPFFKNSDISSYTANTAAKYWLIDFFYPNDRNTDMAEYPRLMAHLSRFKPVLLARKQNNNGIDKLLKKGIYWFASVRRKFDFDAPKLVAPQRSRTNTFAYAPDPWYASSDVYFISHPQKGFSLWYLLALFNSAPYYAWLFYNGKRKGKLLELYSQPLLSLPVIRADGATQAELESLAQEIYEAKKGRQTANTEEKQSRIDALTARLFGLSKAELARTKQAQKNA